MLAKSKKTRFCRYCDFNSKGNFLLERGYSGKVYKTLGDKDLDAYTQNFSDRYLPLQSFAEEITKACDSYLLISGNPLTDQLSL